MPSWAWVLVVIAVIVVIALVAWQAFRKRRSDRLRDRFGPEYDRTLAATEDRRQTEAELSAREERRRQLEVRPLSQAARSRYLDSWQSIQSEFVDDPRAAVASADSLIQRVMADRGYPVEDFEQRAADVSVDHPQVVESYREGHRLATESASGSDSTESLRQAMRHYRTLFEELLEPGADEPIDRGRPSDTPVDERQGRTVS